VAFLATTARFFFLEKSPPGFYIDEAAGATQALCLAQDGTDARGESHPLFFPAFGSFTTPVYVYLAAPWSEVFGSSIAAFRAIAAFASALTVVALFFVGRELLGPGGGHFVALAAALSPPLFQFGRIAWDPPLMVALFAWGLYVLLRARAPGGGALSGLLFGLCVYAYPATRVQLVLLLPALLLLMHRRGPGSLRRAVAFVAVLVVVTLPLLTRTAAGEMSNRYDYLGIFTADYAARAGETPVAWFLARTFAENFLTHFEPRYLFVRGDANLRHSSRFVGELGWLDDLALVAGVGMGLVALVRRRGGPDREPGEGPGRHPGPRIAIPLALCGIVTGVVPSAMTWEGLPHALRSIGAWPFVSILSGTLLFMLVRRRPRSVLLVLVVSVVFAAAFGHHYLTRYPAKARRRFDSMIKADALEARATGDWDRFLDKRGGYGGVSLRYYLIHYGGDTCSSSRERLRRAVGDGTPRRSNSRR
jgi:4-amino-4-deoxy-L-arabinose transferase-like glycosyltransferase